MNQLGGLEKERANFEEKGVQIIALAVQSAEEAATSVEKSEAQFPVLADSEHTVAEAYGVYNIFSDEAAAASVFIINQDSQIIWDHIATNVADRVPAATILANLP